jgi:CspA family cold shock protein
MPVGTVHWYDPERGYGFIGTDDGSKDLFVHASDVKAAGLDPLVEGQRVRFDAVTVGGRAKAVDLRLEKARMKP